MPKEWRAALNRWARFNRKHKTSVEGQLAPSRNEEYFLYQTLLGMWPFQAEANDEAAYSDLIARVKAYMCKAMKEAKVNTSWVNANEDYEAAVMKFIEAILNRQEPKNRFLPDFMAFQKRVAYYGVFNALSQTLLKLTCPGVPDIYQGNETWDFSLVDPDNRRPVDYDLRRRMLDEVSRINDPAGAEQLVEHKEDGRIKLFVTNRALSYRRDNQELFERGSYIPLEAQGTRSENICAFARNHDGKEVIIVAPRFYTRLAAKVSESGPVVGSVWAGSSLHLPQAETGQKYRNIFTGEEFEVKEQDNSHVGLPLDEVLSTFPVALLERMK
jgi:(1->4)-alpha-D-glucan 1-alpha-D-glucosylmutase